MVQFLLNFTEEQPTDVMDTTESEISEMDEDYCCEAEDTSDLKWYSHTVAMYYIQYNHVYALFYIAPCDERTSAGSV